MELVRGTYRVSVKGYWQSGSYAQHILKLGLKHTDSVLIRIKKILILGLGSGSMAKMIRTHYPQAAITGVDIDEKMVEIGRKYMGLDEVNNLKVVIGDALEFLKIHKDTDVYDMIISDLYIGCDTPAHLESTEFIREVYSSLSGKGIYISNRSLVKKYRKKTDEFLTYVKNYFRGVETFTDFPNMVIRAHK